MRLTKLCFLSLSFLILFVSCQDARAKAKDEVVSIQKEIITVNSLSDFKKYIDKDDVKIKLAPGNYQIDQAKSIRFIAVTGNNSHYDLTGVRFMVDTKLFSRKDLAKSDDGNSMYCAIEISGNNTVFEGLYIETYGDASGLQSKNKIFNVVGEGIVLKNVEVRTSGSNPWGYGYLYGLGGGDVRKMNGIRVGYPAKNVSLIGCKVHMRAMGHAIFLQGAENTLIEDCHVDGLLRTTDAILAETSGYGFDRDFYALKPKHAHKNGYVEGTVIGLDGKILPGEIVSLSEDGIRLYPEYQGHPTKNTTVKDCSVFQMRRGICVGLNKFGDKVINCVVRDCVTTGFNVGNEDVVINCSADAKYGEAFGVPYTNAKNAAVNINILDSRNGMANNMLAKINGTGHHIVIKTGNDDFIPKDMAIKLSVWEGYGNYNSKATMHATNIKLENKTQTQVLKHSGTQNLEVESKGQVIEVKS
ncbi:hypothetical protein FPF71_08360 [Algibacter amylolyticus]|uniref:Right-handed parallel beta-helix repeat-containing protein n=1 Tax=Algibacter amylolyticus TaxID=1608400 RepID=A0A5M7BCM4_9FLAO|nr:hypothetical protein [Algibacter amylolyticus]KAA5825194.1 hypothetical protein F2B50_08360 [Algibacter amylolyticus]MBB5268688.1 hypothetical protein [Algibacter amylolyticus]TSJ77688.1 hypothetical protein FPF71_08360 [Algibacter amylolyticus]